MPRFLSTLQFVWLFESLHLPIKLLPNYFISQPIPKKRELWSVPRFLPPCKHFERMHLRGVHREPTQTHSQQGLEVRFICRHFTAHAH